VEVEVQVIEALVEALVVYYKLIAFQFQEQQL
jgi:hypothetical protein